MEKIKTAFLKLFGSFKKIVSKRPKFFYIFKNRGWLFVSAIVFFLLIIYFLSNVFLISPAQAKLFLLQKNISADGPCHEECLLFRKKNRDELAAHFKNNKHFQKDVEKLFLDETSLSGQSATLNFKKELLKIIVDANGAGNPPDFVVDYFLRAEARPELKAEIIKLFLASTNNPDLADYYFSILNSGESVAVKTEAVKALSSLVNKRNYFKLEEIDELKDLVLNSDAPLALKADLIFLLADFYEFFPIESQKALTEIFENSSQNIVKAFVADTLNNLGFSEFIAPEATEKEWAEYFNN